jgi:hypothetical protein
MDGEKKKELRFRGNRSAIKLTHFAFWVTVPPRVARWFIF